MGFTKKTSQISPQIFRANQPIQKMVMKTFILVEVFPTPILEICDTGWKKSGQPPGMSKTLEQTG